MYKLSVFNMKWQLLGYFFAAGLIAMSVLFIVIEYFQVNATDWLFQAMLVTIVPIVTLGVGYVATKRWQRKVDELQLAMLEMSKGNFTGRMTIEPGDSFLYLFETFNRMAQAVEDRVQLLQKLGAAEALREQELTEAAVIEERRRLARDLHDTVSQELFAIHMAASSLPKILERNPAASAGVMDQLIQMSHHAQKQMRGLISQLRPIELNDVTLQEALEKWFPEYCRANELQGQLHVELDSDMSEAIEHQLFLIIQEAMANVVKHASAKQLELSIYETEHQYMLQLQDNGQGFARSDIPSASHGLSTMRERAQKLGGDVNIISRPGAGTRVQVQIPKFTATERISPDSQTREDESDE
ncbi:sensor histidine kinase [Paenibacillus athensensis]|uniref:Oxygen sensor histidine kinase NreB n=1 Tax=Paenibacillus athensensis TaxID=1967502 RepID=A0A4Y8Q460_9BACL|nr:sensor histidine kinase [Paenibacillus athensensis]MCD1260969.1 sensor histidine kinase [Paenibacillus athensensis]